jgi:alkylation response protein AidB-like acyl-CoA dehydrogenase
MEFAFTEEQAMIAETVKAFFAENATSERTRAAMAADGVDRALWTSFCMELGLAGIGIAEEDGGAGLGMVEFSIVAEAAGTHVAALPLLGLAAGARAIAAGGNDSQRQAYLGGILSGDMIVAAAEAGLGAGGHALTLVDGKLSGTLAYVPHGAAADLFVIASDLGVFVLPRDSAGLTVTPQTSLDQSRPLAKLALENVAADALADAGKARAAFRQGGWLCLAAEALGGAQATLDITVAYSKERVQFGRQIGSYQAYKHRLADMMVDIEQARSAVYWAACAVDEGDAEEALALHSAKSFCADTYRACSGHMIQLHGGIGFTWEHDAHLFFKRARSISSLMGDSEWHRQKIADLVMGDAA